MPDIQTLLIFAAASLALTATPGPDMLLIATRSVSQGRSAGFASLAGVQAGTYCHAIAAAFGLSQLLVAFPAAFDAVRYAGAAYLLLLAWQAFKSDGILAAPTAQPARFTPGLMFRQGLLTNLFNPKMALFVLALFPQFVSPAAGSVVTQFIVLATILNVIGLMVNGAVILAAGTLAAVLRRGDSWSRLPRMLLGTVFVGLAARMAFDGRR